MTEQEQINELQNVYAMLAKWVVAMTANVPKEMTISVA